MRIDTSRLSVIGRTQNVSKRLSDLDAALRTQLLYRRTRGVDRTPAGLTA
jgi:DNA-binding transcriptional LysR family regulator